MKPSENLDPFPYRDFQTALSLLESSLEGPGESPYALLSGESGSGKTTLLRTLSRGIDRSRFQILYLVHGRPSPSALARVLAQALHLPMQSTRAETSRLLFQSLRHLPARLLLWIDESHMISEDALQEIRLLAEADLEGPPLFSVILSGLPSLKDKLLGPELFPLWRRVSVKASLGGLMREEVEPFLAHRFGPKEAHRFTPEACLALLEHSRGLPALVIQLARACWDAFPDQKIEAHQLAEMAQGIQS
jgi:general secretion pathway protein A